MTEPRIEEVIDSQDFKENLVTLMNMQQKANKNNMILHVASIILDMLLFLLIMVLVANISGISPL